MKRIRTKTAKRRYRLLLLGCALLVAMLLLCGYWFWQPPKSVQEYPVRGLDVSHHQGEIQWRKIKSETYAFVYIKATEGDHYQDPKFQLNWLAAREQGLHVGAYHFYRLCLSGQAQADNFIASVPNKPDALPPVIDLEFDGNCKQLPYTKEQLLKEIGIMHDALMQHYQKQPVFYVSQRFYHLMLMGKFPQVPLWIRNYHGRPKLKDQRSWSYWQYSNHGKVAGIATPVDLNVFAGNMQQWHNHLKAMNRTAKP